MRQQNLDLGLWVVLKHVREHVLSLRAILDNLPISINDSKNPVAANLLKIYRNVCTQTSKYHILPMTKMRHAELQ